MIEFNFLARGRGGHVLVVQQAVVALLAAVVGSFFGRQRLLFSLVRHSKWMLRDTWALVWVKTNGQFRANGDGRVFYQVFWKLFPTLGVGFSVELTTFVCPPHSADWLRSRTPHFTGPSKRPRSGTFPRNTTTATMCYINFTLTLYNYLPSLSIWCSRRSQV